MLKTLAITGPIYIVIALGFLAVRFEVFTKPDLRALGQFVVKFALPALVFTALSQRPVRELVDLRYLAAYAIGSLALMLGAFFYARRRQHKGMPLSALFGMGMSCSNSGFIGYPIAVQVLGPEAAAAALAMNMLIENLLMIPLTLALAEREAGPQQWHAEVLQSLGRLAVNPVILAIFAGFFVSLLDIDLSEPLARTVNMLAMSSTALALFVIGGSLVGLQVEGMRTDVATVAFGKLLLHPLFVFAAVWVLSPADLKLRAAAVVFAGVPMLSIYPILAQKYREEGFSAAALLLTTMLSFVSISVLLWVLGPGLGWSG
jgi:malonate transporter and related proteins